MTQAQLVSVHREDRAAYITLDRPDSHNLVTHGMLQQLVDALRAVSDADVVVVRGAGTDFSLGRDQTERVAGISQRQRLGLVVECNRLLDELPGVSLALVRGRALGLGSGLVLHCDLALASEDAVLGFDEIAHGFPPLLVETYLSSYVPRKAAADLVLTGRPVQALEAHTLGMVSRVVAEDELDAAGAALVARLMSFDARALRRGKRFLREVDDVPAAERPAYGLRELLHWWQADR